MKQFLLILVIPFAVFSQQRDEIRDKISQRGEAYVDSVKVDLGKVFLDMDNIIDIRSYRGEMADPFTGAGAVTFITRKNKTPLIRLDSFVKNSESLKDKPRVNLIVNGKVMEHPEEYFAEETAIAGITIVVSSPESTGSYMMQTPSVIITLKQYK